MITWYDRAQAYDNDITQEAGIRENILSGILGALVMMLGGADSAKAASTFKVDKNDVESYSKNPSMVEKAKEVKSKTNNTWDSEEINRTIRDIQADTERMRREWEEQHKKAPEVKGQPHKHKVKPQGKHQDKPNPKLKPESPNTKNQHASTTVGKALIDVIISLEGTPHNVINSVGAAGTMQILRPTWEEINRKRFGGEYPYSQYATNDSINRMFGEYYLNKIKEFLDQHKSEWKTDQASLILACYHGGIGNIEKAKFDPAIIKKKMPRTYDYMTRGSNLLGSRQGN